MDAVEFLTSTIASGLAYDYLKCGCLITAKNVKEFFSDELYEITNDQARVISSNIQKIQPSDIQTLNKDQFINKYKNLFENLNVSITNDSTTINSTNALTNMGSQTINGDIHIGTTPQKKTN